jgi:hypothetical protein
MIIRTILGLPVKWLLRQDPLDEDGSECRMTVSAMGDIQRYVCRMITGADCNGNYMEAGLRSFTRGHDGHELLWNERHD